MAIPPQFLKRMSGSSENGAEQETTSDRKKDSPAVKAKEYGGKKKKYSKAQQDAIQRRLKGGKGSGRN